MKEVAASNILCISVIGHVPFVERLVEGVCVPKHTSHSLHVGHVPLVERLVEGVCVSKHSP